MPRQKDLLQEIARQISSNRDYRIAAWFTEDFRLSEPGKPDWPTGHKGARQMLKGFDAFDRPFTLEPLDMIEEGGRVAVRWHLTTAKNGEPLVAALMAMYRFENGRIARDWGIPILGDWP
jgi:ketosteroid isomerase-like protein